MVKQTVIIRSSEQISEGIYSAWIENKAMSLLAVPGQFLSIYCKDTNSLLPRPISICEINKETGTIRIVFRIAGKGTEEFSGWKQGDRVEVMGPLGNGYQLQQTGHAVLIGGGIGIPPLLELCKQLPCEKTIVLGYRDNVFLADEFSPYGRVVIATEDGSCGTKGNVIDAIKMEGVIVSAASAAETIGYACGPIPMLRGVANWAAEAGIRAQISMEERMACGIGACLACVCKSKDKDEHTNVHNKRICKEGPVFWTGEVEL